MQLLSASFCIVIGYSETWAGYSGIWVIIPIVGLVIALLNIIFARFYEQFAEKFGDQFEMWLLKLNGVVMLITGMGYHIFGSKYIQYTYYVISILFFIVLPKFVLPAKKKRLVLDISESSITINKLIKKSVVYSWKNIESVSFLDSTLRLMLSGRKKALKLYLNPNELDKLTQLHKIIEAVKIEKDQSERSKER